MRIADLFLILRGATSGEQIIKAAAAASGAITLPAGTTDFSATGGAGQVVKQTSAGGAFTVGTVAVSDIGNVTAARLLGNPTGSAAAPSEISLGTNLSFSGTVLDAAGGGSSGLSGMTAGQIPIAATATTITSSGNLSGDVVSTATTLATTIQANAVTTAKINNSAVTYAKIQNVTNNRLLGNTSGSAAAPAEVALPLAVANGGTGLASGASGGIPYYSATGTIASSAALTANALIKGGGAGLSPVASTATVDGSGNLTATGSLTVSGNANPALGVASGYTNLFAPDAATNNRGVFIGSAATGFNYYRNTKHDFQDTSYTPVARIDAGGFYLSNSLTNPALAPLTAQFTALYAPDGSSSTAAIVLGNAGNPKHSHSNTQHFFYDRTSATLFCYFDSTGCYKPGGGTWTTISDVRLKRNVASYTAGLDALTRLRPVTYQHNGKGGTSDDGRVFHGLVADEAGQVMPELVGTLRAKLDPEDEDESDILTLDATPLTYAMLNAIKELGARVAALEAALSARDAPAG
jgi:hypothetical protein